MRHSFASNLAILLKLFSLSIIYKHFALSPFSLSQPYHFADALINELNTALMHAPFMFIRESRNLSAGISPATPTHVILHLTSSLTSGFLVFFFVFNKSWVSVTLNGMQQMKAIGKLSLYTDTYVESG